MTDIIAGGSRSFSDSCQLSPSLALPPGVLGVSDPGENSDAGYDVVRNVWDT